MTSFFIYKTTCEGKIQACEGEFIHGPVSFNASVNVPYIIACVMRYSACGKCEIN